MPRNPSVPHGQILNAILDAEGVIDSNGQATDRSAKVWEDIATSIGHPKIPPSYLHTYVAFPIYSDRWNCYCKLLEKHEIVFPTPPKVSVNHLDIAKDGFEEVSDPESVSLEASVKDQVIKPTRTFNVLIPADKWMHMKPIAKIVKCKERGTRTRLAIPSDSYGSELRHLLWTQHKLPCPYSIKRTYVSDSLSRRQYVKIDANCNECGAEAVGRVLSEPLDGEDVTLLWKSTDSRGVQHQSRQRLKGDERDAVGKRLQHSSCEGFRREVARENMDSGDPAPPFPYSQDVLRHAKAESLDKRLGIIGGKHAISNLQSLKHREPYAGGLHEICVDKFRITYHAPQQTEIYRNHKKNSNYVSLSIDATGGLAEKLVRPHDLSGHIFLYEAVMHTGQAQIPVTQMLSEKNDAVTIAYWLKEWERSGGAAPNEVVVDDSGALKNAVAAAFCRGFDKFEDVRRKCFDYLSGRSTDLPSCYIRLDAAHFLNCAKRWKCWKDETLRRSKQFYLDCLGLLMKATTLAQFKEILHHIFVVSLSPHEGHCLLDGSRLPMEVSLEFLSAQIESSAHIAAPHTADESEETEDSVLHLPDVGEGALESQCSLPIKEWLQALRTEVDDEVVQKKGNRLNPYFSNRVADHFQSASLDFPHWSAVLFEAYGSPYLTPSSAPVESEFKVLKKDILKETTTKLRVDRLFAIHYLSIEGQCLILQGTDQTQPQIIRSGQRRAMELKTSNAKAVEELEGTIKNYVKKLGESEDDPNEKLETDLFAFDQASEAVEDFSSSDSEALDKETVHLRTTENWRNQGKQKLPLKTPKRSHLDPQPGVRVAILAGELYTPKHRILTNGNKLKSIRTSASSRVLVKNTCGFDSLVQILATAYADNEAFRKNVDESENMLMKTTKLLAVKGAVSETYVFRAETIAAVWEPEGVLQQPTVYSTRSNRKSVATISYNCFSNATVLTENLLKNLPSFRIDSKCTSPECLQQHLRNVAVIDVEIDFLLENGLEKSEEGVNNAIAYQKSLARKCEDCGSETSSGTEVGWLLAINIDVLSDQRMKMLLEKPSPHNREHALEEFPSVLNVGTEPRKFAGVVIYRPDIEHYIGVAKRQQGFWESFDDLSKKVKRPAADILVQPHVLVYTI